MGSMSQKIRFWFSKYKAILFFAIVLYVLVSVFNVYMSSVLVKSEHEFIAKLNDVFKGAKRFGIICDTPLNKTKRDVSSWGVIELERRDFDYVLCYEAVPIQDGSIVVDSFYYDISDKNLFYTKLLETYNIDDEPTNNTLDKEGYILLFTDLMNIESSFHYMSWREFSSDIYPNQRIIDYENNRVVLSESPLMGFLMTTNENKSNVYYLIGYSAILIVIVVLFLLTEIHRKRKRKQ